MKLIYLCGSLEEGRDGVGDYTRTLAVQMNKLGHSVCCISIHDSFTSEGECNSVISQPYLLEMVRIYRFSQRTDWYTRLRTIRRILQTFKPDWASLQYVPYSFGQNGIPLQFTSLCSLLRGPWKWHFMFHELWIDGGNSLKKSTISNSQKFLIRATERILQPSITTTTINRYASMLAEANIYSRILRLHSNISVPSNGKPLPIRKDSWIFLFFGSLDHKWPTEPFFSYIESARCSSGAKQCIFLKLGRSSENSKTIWNNISKNDNKRMYPAFSFVDIGEKCEAEVSDWLMKSSFGISMAPLQWIGKSGSVAAMIDHGLPVIVPNYDVSFDDSPLESFPFANQLIRIDQSLPAKIQELKKSPLRNSVAQAAEYQIDLLSI